MRKIIFLSLATIFITACNKGPNFAELCEEHSQICLEFEEDSWCKKERIKVGFANLNFKLEKIDENKFHQLIAYENYAKCMSHAAKIEHIKLKEKKTMRVNNVIKAKQKIKDISDETKSSEHPFLLHYHWSRYLNEKALNKFLVQEGTPALETSISQYNLATFYAKRDLKKTLRLLYHALELHQEGEELNVEIFKSISTIYIEQDSPKHAYVWLKVLNLQVPKDETLTEQSLEEFVLIHELDSDPLDSLAKSTLNQILSGEFVAPSK